MSHQDLPDWVPAGAQHYVAHTKQGAPIRAIARAAGCHASTVLRQIRKLEMRRDDPLVDAALHRLSHITAVNALTSKSKSKSKKDTAPMTQLKPIPLPDDVVLEREGLRVLRRLCEAGAVLAVAAEMEKAVVVRDCDGISTRTAVVEAEVAQAMALKNWIAPVNTGRIVRYRITATGRNALEHMLKTSGGLPQEPGNPTDEEPEMPPGRYTLGESPLITLSRRREKDGSPFLSDDLVHAGERLREDFELAQMEPHLTQNWDNFLTGGVPASRPGSGPVGLGPAAARARVGDALTELGPGLSDIVLRCCCYLEGLEAAEKRLGWSARSAKIVLRIALMRLRKHYDETLGLQGQLIG